MWGGFVALRPHAEELIDINFDLMFFGSQSEAEKAIKIFDDLI